MNSKIDQLLGYLERNKEGVGIGLALLTFGVSALTKAMHGASMEKRRRDAYEMEHMSVYDHSLGMRHYLTRPMTPSEKERFAERRASGESVLGILTGMGILRR